MKEDIEEMWNRIADILGKYATPSDFALFNEVLEELVKTAEEQQQVIGFMAKDIAERTESCPYDLYDYKIENCDEVCDSIKVAKCFIEYYEKKARGE